LVDSSIALGAVFSRRLLALCAGVLLVWPAPALAQKKEKAPETFAIISVSVFRDPGFSLPGAEIDLQPDTEGKTSIKVKKMKAVSDRRGELAFRVPAAAMRYTVTIRAKGYQSATRQVTIAGEERQDVFVTLKAARETSQ
jgi:hypothetical protein